MVFMFQLFIHVIWVQCLNCIDMKNARFALVVCMLIFYSDQLLAQLDQCKGIAPFLTQLGFDPARCYFTTSEKHDMGLMLLESSQPGNPNARITKRYQHPSWKSAGFLGAIATDEAGNIYVLPTAKVNLLHNLPALQNTIYKVDANTGVMDAFLSLQGGDKVGPKNPFGLLGSFYDCSTKQLWVSTVAGSHEGREIGKVYAVDVKTRKTTLILENKDIYGLAIHLVQGKRTLFLSSARSSNLYTIELNGENKPIGKLTQVLSIQGLGPRGDDRIRKIRFQSNGNMILNTVMFYYNLTAPSEEQQSKFIYQMNPSSQKWDLIQIQ